MSNTKTLTAEALRQFSGSETLYRYSLNRKVLYTEGAQYLAEQGGPTSCYRNCASTCQRGGCRRVPGLDAQSEFRLLCLLTCDDGNGHIVYDQSVPYTDFPLPEVKPYFCNNVIMLPGEY
ncbi:MAG: hypothetical protein A4E19_00765 [Nitrospira sp. SG-bin1]|nr:MAG: hypothetical protein A4E19_00765 [Nitrospira sp. SG-bin1]